jgi:2-dehydropantoate 2-reductase
MAIIVGAGAVGLALGTRLAASGEPVLFVVRRAEAAAAILREGVSLEDPASGELLRAGAGAIAGIEAARDRLADENAGPVLLCVRTTETDSLAHALAAVAPHACVASVQNDVDNEEILARHFRRVIGVVWRQTCTRTSDTTVRALGRGRVIVGAHPSADEATQESVAALAARLRRAEYDVGVSARIAEDKWLKLCINLMSAPNALVVPEDHATVDFVETKARLLEEARDVLAAAGIVARSCDGRDRGLDDEITFQRESLARGQSARRLPVYNQIWSALRTRRSLEGDRYHRRIIELGARHGIPTPVNARVLELLQQAFATHQGPESLRASTLTAVRGRTY